MYAEKIEYDDIEMSSRLRNILGRNGFESLEGLREYPKEHFIKFRNMRPTTLQELYRIFIHSRCVKQIDIMSYSLLPVKRRMTMQ